MLQAFKQHITKQFSELENASVLIAVSGGVDSMVLAHLCHAINLKVAWAHCNFKLRGADSDLDAQFVEDTAKKMGIPCYSKEFATADYAVATKQSTQMAARSLRYEWFESLCAQFNYDFILTAHHANDALETFLIHIGRGSGIDGLCSIPERSGKVRRVLLPFSRKQIKNYAIKEKIVWREDASNQKDTYLRNHLRHHAVKELENAIPHFLEAFKKTNSYLNQSQRLLNVYKKQLQDTLLYPVNSVQGVAGKAIDLVKLQAHPEHEAVLYTLLSEYGFTAWEDIYRLLDGQSGKQVFSTTHRIVRNRQSLLLYPRYESGTSVPVFWNKGAQQVSIAGGVLTMMGVEVVYPCSNNEILVDFDTLNFPLVIRPWREGDCFYPFGMKGKKKLSKYFKDEKLSLIAKEEVQVLCSEDAVVWVIGYRLDRRFAVSDATKNIINIKRVHDTI